MKKEEFLNKISEVAGDDFIVSLMDYDCERVEMRWCVITTPIKELKAIINHYLNFIKTNSNEGINGVIIDSDKIDFFCIDNEEVEEVTVLYPVISIRTYKDESHLLFLEVQDDDSDADLSVGLDLDLLEKMLGKQEKINYGDNHIDEDFFFDVD
jgi:hypothetical protein